MKRAFFVATFFLFSLFPVLAQFQRLDGGESPYFNFDFSNSIDCYNVDHEKCPLSMASKVSFITKYFDAQTGFAFQTKQASLNLNLMGYYTFDFGLSIGGLSLLNANFYYDLANELDRAGAGYVSFKTKPVNFWKFCLVCGYGGMSTWIQYKIRGEKKWTKPETVQTLIVDITIMKNFLERNTLWFDILTYENNKFSYGIAPSFALGYSFDFNKSWQVYAESKLNCVAFLTTIGALESFELKFGGRYRLLMGGAK